MKKIVSTTKAPSAIGPYNQATSFEKLVFTSGQIALDPTTMEIVNGGVQEQTKQVMENLKAVLEEASSSFENVLKTTCYLSDMDNFVAFNEIYWEYFKGETAPARSTVAVVAGEVRNLANRSAQAANEIKNIVEIATQKADEGKHIANSMINGYSELNSDIMQTIDLIKEFENSSKEQLLGIEQINNAVAILDQKTQQNANVTSQTKDIAISTNSISKLIIEDVNKKRFKDK